MHGFSLLSRKVCSYILGPLCICKIKGGTRIELQDKESTKRPHINFAERYRLASSHFLRKVSTSKRKNLNGLQALHETSIIASQLAKVLKVARRVYHLCGL